MVDAKTEVNKRYGYDSLMAGGHFLFILGLPFYSLYVISQGLSVYPGGSYQVSNYLAQVYCVVPALIL